MVLIFVAKVLKINDICKSLGIFDVSHLRLEDIYTWTFRPIFGTKKKNSKKITQAGGVGNQHLPLALSAFYSKIYNRLISPNGLERLIASDCSAQNYQNAENTALL